MTSWMKERDRLVEQTLAFVQGVAAQRPIRIAAIEPAASEATSAIMAVSGTVTATPDTDPAAGETDALISLIALSQPLESGTPDSILAPITAAEPLPPIRMSVRIPHPVPVMRKPADTTLPERDVIARRVARFRAGQQKLIRDRDDNYAMVQAKIRATLGNDPAS